ncbi:MAG: hypothetical protein ACT4PE_05730 [Candidatus Eiseniibacteriota bacterium]
MESPSLDSLRKTPRTTWGWILGAVALAAVLRFSVLPPWLAFDGDEFWTLKWTARPVVEILTRYTTGLTMHLYLVAMKGWIGVAGSSPLAVKLPTLIGGILLVPVVFAAGLRWLGPVPAALAAVMVAVSGPLIDSARTARVYPFLTAAVVLAMLAFERALSRGSRADLLRLAGANALALALSLNATVAVLVQGAALLLETLVDPRGRWRRAVAVGTTFALSGAAAALFYAAALPDILRTSDLSTGPRFHPEMLVGSFVRNHPAAPVAFVLLLGLGVLAALRRHGTAGRLLVVWALLPALFYFVQRLRYPEWAIARYLLVHAPAQMLLMALGLGELLRGMRVPTGWRTGLGAAFVIALALSSEPSRALIFRSARPSGEALHRLAEIAAPGDVVTHDFPPYEFLIDLEPRLDGRPLPRLLENGVPSIPGRLLVLTFGEPRAKEAWSRHFQVETLGGPRYRYELYVLVSRAAPADGWTVRGFLEGLVEAAANGAELDITAARHFAKLEEVHGMLEQLAEAEGDAAAREEHRRLRERYAARAREEWRSIL